MLRLLSVLAFGFVTTAFTRPGPSLEQIATDYFFSDIFREEYPDYKAIEFDNQTDTSRYWSTTYKCVNWDDEIKRQILSSTPDRSTQVTATVTDLRVKKVTRNSGKLRISVWSKVKVGNSYFVLIGAYRKLRFSEYFLFELDSEGRIIQMCKQGEII